MDEKINKLITLLNSLPISKWGVGDISGLHTLSQEFPKVISLVFAYKPDFLTYDESKFHKLTLENKATINSVIETLKDFLEEENIKYYIPENSIDENFVGEFSSKLAATRAGLGWVGKNSAFITEEFGPRSRLGAILINLDLPVNEPVTESKCGQCKVCVESCPHNCIRGQNWTPGIERDLLFDAFKCKHVGHQKIEALGREFSCGICVFSCPRGKAYTT